MFNGTGIEQFTLLGKLDCSQLGFLRGKKFSSESWLTRIGVERFVISVSQTSAE